MAKDKIWFENGELRFKARVEGMSKAQVRARLADVNQHARIVAMEREEDPNGSEADKLAIDWCRAAISDLRGRNLNERFPAR